ncbi:hypothetical protein [Amedibacterium intestinale]|uniref:hypothetical protein n=1 Tax=Amedibacterium intestinale TaxID=2583452 RepID=UPI0013007F1C
MEKEINLFEGVDIKRLEKAIGLLYSNDEIEVKVKLIPKNNNQKEKEQVAACPKEK